MSNQNELIPLLPGDILRHRREQEGISLEDAAARSRIKLDILSAIESGETTHIPSVYLRGYTRNYARFLGVDLSELESHLDKQQGAEPVVRTIFEVDRRRGFTEKWLKVTSYVAASALIGTLAWQFTHEAVRFSQGDAKLGPATSRAQEEAGDANITPPAKTHLNASIASVGAMKQRPPVKDPWAAIGDETDEPVPMPSSEHSLAIRTSADTWVEISDRNGEQVEMDLMRGGSVRRYSGQPPFRVMIGRASAVELKMDDQLVDLGPHTRGNVARLTLGGEAEADPALRAEAGAQPSDESEPDSETESETEPR